jgi:Type II secretion system (T2SS), protein E, N-terminal domain
MALSDTKMIEAIGFFEDMLQTMPTDRTALEFLAVAYEQTKQDEKRRDILVRLVDVLLMEGDFGNAKAIAEHLKAFPDHMPAQLAIERVAAMTEMDAASNPPQDTEGGAADSDNSLPRIPIELPTDVHSISHASASAEMDLVWYWHDHDFIPKELCMDVMNAITDRPVTETPLLISALAILDEGHPEYTDKLLEMMYHASSVPPIPIEFFEPTAAAINALHPTFCHVRGVLPFSMMGNELLVAILNPINKELKKEVLDRSGKPCHFFMAHPKTWQAMFEKAFLTVEK